jgi:Holliday junction resolvase
MRRAAKSDRNQSEIVQALRDAGFSVLVLSRVGQGCPDLLVGRFGKNYLLEVKCGTSTQLTPDETQFFEQWRGNVTVIRSADDALSYLDYQVVQP